jgi:hypothetical protein
LAQWLALKPLIHKVSTPRPLYIQTTNEEIVRSAPRALNYVSALVRRRARYEALKAKWEEKHPDKPYPHSRPEADTRRGAAARK